MTIYTITAQQLYAMLQANDATVIDVREPAEFASGHIAGATSVPLGSLCCNGLPPSDKKLVLHCKAGRRGDAACAKLKAEDAERELYHLDGGLDAWVAAGFPVTQATRKILPLDRQVQLSIGLLLLLASTMGFATQSPAWFALSGFIGMGLSVAGLTGFCGLARLLARAPWNQRR